MGLQGGFILCVKQTKPGAGCHFPGLSALFMIAEKPGADLRAKSRIVIKAVFLRSAGFSSPGVFQYGKEHKKSRPEVFGRRPARVCVQALVKRREWVARCVYSVSVSKIAAASWNGAPSKSIAALAAYSA